MKKYLRLVGIIILCVILSRIDLTKIISCLTKVNISLLIFVVLLNVTQIFLKSYRWNRLLQKQSIQYNLKDSFLVYLSSIYAGFITPGRLGEFVKAVYLKSDKGISLSRGMSSVLLDRLFDLYLLIILGSIGIWQFALLGKISDISLVMSIVVILSPLLMLNRQLMEKLLKSLYNIVIIKKAKGKIDEKFEDFYNGLNELIGPELLFSGLLTCLSYLIFFTQCYLIVIAMGISVNFISITLFMAISNLISFVPISISGLGTRDAALIYFFSLIGLKSELAVSYAFLIFITFFVCGGLMGAVAWWIKPPSLDRPPI